MVCGRAVACGDERIIVFTTNHKDDKLDPALLRPGLPDLHIHLSCCTPSGFTTLAFKKATLIPCVEILKA
ncbi:putative P-loop containing nucleoside triphosphate hydrolase [Rosa chinensis]|uniref:Putative P-loop containing nucleoside triphosphate hydrolase n=1 Tax=Rosa chinensis TaxID=74649 RepID=A0A2P6RM13_ROSCH|nr:putative P-loop containing nucleoside triphosphate hydrolase [Rosa chinensis]